LFFGLEKPGGFCAIMRSAFLSHGEEACRQNQIKEKNDD
jgi:hypothetical protein